jgi:integrase/recombinase XerD
MPKNLFKRAGIWWFQKMYKGRRYRYSLETANQREAQARAEAKLLELKATHWGEKPRRSYKEAAERFMDEYLPTLRPKSQERYLVSLGQLSAIFEPLRLDEISSGSLYEFEQTRYRGGASKPTIRRDLACLSSLMSFAMTLEWVTANPVPAYMKARSKKGLKEAEPKTRYLDKREESAILLACEREARDVGRSGRGKGDTARLWMEFAESIAFAIDTGLRKEEQFSLMRHHIDFQRQEVIVDAIIAKNGKERRVPLLPRALEIARRRALNSSSAYLFPAANGNRYSERSGFMLKKLKMIALRAKIAPLVWHDLRRTCGCRLLQDMRLPMERVCRWLGHSSIQVTEKHYAFLRVEDLHQSVREAADRVGNVTKLRSE